MVTAPLFRVVIDTAVRTVSEEEINQQKQDFKLLLQELGQASRTEIEVALGEREKV